MTKSRKKMSQHKIKKKKMREKKLAKNKSKKPTIPKDPESTHFLFDGEKFVTSPDIGTTVRFLIDIEEEINNLLQLEDRLEGIRKQYLELLDVTAELGQLLKANSIDFSIPISEKPEAIIDKLRMNEPQRSQMIILFAYLETIMRINYIYDTTTTDVSSVRQATMSPDVYKPFYKNFCLSQENEWSSINSQRISNISPRDLRYFRNGLTHVFSIEKNQPINIGPSSYESDNLQLEKNLGGAHVVLSPKDLHEITKGAVWVLIRKFHNDYVDNQNGKKTNFKKKILAVEEYMKENAPVKLYKSEEKV